MFLRWNFSGHHPISHLIHRQTTHFAAHPHCVSLYLRLHTLTILGIEFLWLPHRRHPSLSLHMLYFFFLFLVRVKSGTASVFHHRNRHNRPCRPSSGSANRDQIKSIIPSVCAKAFFLLPPSLFLSLRHLGPYFRAVPVGARRDLGLNKVLNVDVIRQVAFFGPVSVSTCKNKKRKKLHGETA